MKNLKTENDRHIILRNRASNLVRLWTEKAQSDSITEEKREIYYECAESLHNIS